MEKQLKLNGEAINKRMQDNQRGQAKVLGRIFKNSCNKYC